MKAFLSAVLVAGSTLASGECGEITRPQNRTLPGGLDATRVGVIASSGMNFENSPADLADLSFELSANLAEPFPIFAGYTAQAAFRYETHMLRTSGLPSGIPLHDKDLHEIDLSLALYQMPRGTRWFSGAWINPSLATDFDGLSSDDLFLDLAIGAGYRVLDQLSIGTGVMASNLTGDASIYPGLALFWKPADDLKVILYGPNLRCSWDLTDSWCLGFEIRPNGGTWNIDSPDGSRNLHFRSFRSGLHSSHRLSEEIWLTYGAGITNGNKLEIQTTGGSEVFANQLGGLDSGLYGFFAIGLKSW